jgi:hypothetical protein
VPVLWLALISPVVLLALMLAMERVERGLSEPEPDGRSDR